MNKLEISKIRDLSISAASGLVKVEKKIFVVADDELSLSCYLVDDKDFNQVYPLLSGSLPDKHKERKKQKPDWEALCLLPESASLFKKLLVIPSGSKPQRMTGSLLEIQSNGIGTPKKIDFSLLYDELLKTFSELNIEGAAVHGPYLKLFQRGNGSKGQNAIIELDYENFLSSLYETQSLGAQLIQNISNYDLGKLSDISLSFADACSLSEEKLFFLAVAEDGDSTYLDGEFQGAILGCLDKEGRVILSQELDCPYKPEGLWVENIANQTHIYIVTDADNREQKASLYHGILPL